MSFMVIHQSMDSVQLTIRVQWSVNFFWFHSKMKFLFTHPSLPASFVTLHRVVFKLFHRPRRKPNAIAFSNRFWDGDSGLHGYLGSVFLHSLEVDEGGVDQVVAVDNSHQLSFDTVALSEAEHLPQLRILPHKHGCEAQPWFDLCLQTPSPENSKHAACGAAPWSNAEISLSLDVSLSRCPSIPLNKSTLVIGLVRPKRNMQEL